MTNGKACVRGLVLTAASAVLIGCGGDDYGSDASAPPAPAPVSGEAESGEAVSGEAVSGEAVPGEVAPGEVAPGEVAPGGVAGQTGEPPAGQAADPQAGELADSPTLRREMLDAAIDMVRAEQPDADASIALTQLAGAVDVLRSHDSSFLMVSPADEQKLAAGQAIGGAEQRIEAAEATLSQAPRKSRIVEFLLAKHKAGELSPVRTELLAQFMQAQAKQLEAALTQ